MMGGLEEYSGIGQALWNLKNLDFGHQVKATFDSYNFT